MEFGHTLDGSPLAVVYWFTYDALGNPIFMLGTGSPAGNRVEIAFHSPVGMVFGEFLPETVSREDGGTAVIEFTDRENATFNYTPSEFTVTQWGHGEVVDLALIKLFGIDAAKSFKLPAQEAR